MRHRLRDWRDTRVERRTRVMSNEELTAGYWSNRGRFFSIRVFMACAVAGALLFYASSRANDSDIERQNARLAAQNRELRKTVNEIIKSRKEARLNTCRQDYAAAIRARNTAHAQAVGLITIARATAPPDKPLNESAAAAYIADQDARAAAANPLRDCSTGGIEDFYTNAPDVPPCPHGGDGKGRCAPAMVQP